MKNLKKRKNAKARYCAIPVSEEAWQEIQKAFRRMRRSRSFAERRGVELRDLLIQHGMNELTAGHYAFGAIYGRRGIDGHTWEYHFRKSFEVRRAEVSKVKGVA